MLDFRGPIIGSLKSQCTTSYRSLIETIALNCLVFQKIAFLHFGIMIQDGELIILATVKINKSKINMKKHKT